MQVQDINRMADFSVDDQIVRVELRMIGAEEARELLQRNTKNRRQKLEQIHKYVNDMQNGKWRFNGAPIVIDADGVLIDGQHRLEALAAINVTLPFLVVSGVSAEAFETIDDGSKRTVSDVLGIEGKKNTHLLASVANAMLRYEKTGSFGNNSSLGITKQDQLAWAADPDNYQRFCTLSLTAQKVNKQSKINMTAQIVSALLFIERHGPLVTEQIMNFWDRVISGVPDSRGNADPSVAMRNFALATVTSQKSRGTKLEVWVVAICRALMAELDNSNLKLIRVRMPVVMPELS